MAAARTKAPFPSKEAILAFIEESATPVTRKELVRAFGLRGSDRAQLRAVISELEEAGQLAPTGRRRYAAAGTLPPVTVVQVTGLDPDGELLARPLQWPADKDPPVIYMAPERRGRPALAEGDRVLARLKKVDDEVYEGRIMRVLGAVPKSVLGIYEIGERGGRLRPTDKRAKQDYVVRPEEAGGAQAGELVLAEVKPRHGRLGLREATVVERLGAQGDQRALSLIAIHEHGLPHVFSDEAVAEAEAAGPADLAAREDLRELALVTIDGADARDFDDAVWAEPDPEVPGGWHILVAIADVAHYVRPASALDRAARERGNSVYFPDRVVPMLPEALSNGWCSLVPNQERPCLAAHIWLDPEGKITKHRFLRGLMRSRARLTYEQVEAAYQGDPDEQTGPLMAPVIQPLYGAFRALLAARAARGTLELDLPERQIKLDQEGKVIDIAPRQRLDSHRLIEEFMIAANVAAAETLERLRQPCMYRVHDQPDPQKVEALRESLRSLDYRLAKGQPVRGETFNRILKKFKSSDYYEMINDIILRTQSQAVYSPKNIGHFGLALTKYAHFTSPIRRYSDLLVHRALITGHGWGGDGLPDGAGDGFAETAQHISETERRAQVAERDTLDRFTAAFLSEAVGRILTGRVRGVTRFGLFVELDETGGDALVPMRSLPDDRYDHDERRHCLIGRRWGRIYRLGERVAGRLTEADPVTGGLLLSLVEKGNSDGIGPNEEPEPAEGWDPLKETISYRNRKPRRKGRR